MQTCYVVVVLLVAVVLEAVRCEWEETSVAERHPRRHEGEETGLDLECEVTLENVDFSAVEVVETEEVPYVLQMRAMLKAQISETECRSCYALMKAGTTEGVILKCFECKPLENPEDLIPDDEKEAKQKTSPPYRVSPTFFETKLVLSSVGDELDLDGTQIGTTFFDDENYD